MARCALLKALSDTDGTGVYIQFSQYANDLAALSADPAASIPVPSRYVCLNLGSLSGGNTVLPTALQDYYENKFACLNANPDSSDDDKKNIRNYELSFLLTCLNRIYGGTLLDDTALTASGVCCFGDIYVQNSRNIDGTTYSETYVTVPAAQQKIKAMPLQRLAQDTTAAYKSVASTIAGWTDKPYTDSLDMTAQYDSDNSYYKYYRPGQSGAQLTGLTLDFSSSAITADTASYFDFNAIIILYNLCASDGTVLYKDIPAGLYLTGDFSSDSIANPVRKYVHNADINGEGTSYSLRLSNRFSVQGAATMIETENIDSPIASEIDTFNEAAARMADAIETIEDMAAERKANDEAVMKALASFRNWRANVPYIKTLAGGNYWFVNGRNTGIIAGITEADYAAIAGIPDVVAKAVAAAQLAPFIIDKSVFTSASKIEDVFGLAAVVNTEQPLKKNALSIKVPECGSVIINAEGVNDYWDKNISTETSYNPVLIHYASSLGNYETEGTANLKKIPVTQIVPDGWTPAEGQKITVTVTGGTSVYFVGLRTYKRTCAENDEDYTVPDTANFIAGWYAGDISDASVTFTYSNGMFYV